MTAEQRKLADLIGDLPIAMLTTFGGDGLRSVPMARQEVEPDAEMWFITARSTHHAADIMVEPRVALTFSSRDTWVAVAGRAELVDDRRSWQTSGTRSRRPGCPAWTTPTRCCSG